MGLFGRILYKTTGIMTKSQIRHTCLQVGKDLSAAAKSKSVLSESDVAESLNRYIGPRTKRKFNVARSQEEGINHLVENLGYDRTTADMAIKYGFKAAALPQGKGERGLLFLNMEKMASIPDAIDASTHEIEHLLYQQTSLRGTLAKFMLKYIYPKNHIDKFVKKYGQVGNETNMDFQRSLLRQLGLTGYETEQITQYTNLEEALLTYSHCPNRRSLYDKIDKLLLYALGISEQSQKHSSKMNWKILNLIKVGMQDESRAYRIGSTARKQHVGSNNVSLNDMVSEIYREAIKAVNVRKREEIIHYILEKLHLDKFFKGKKIIKSMKVNVASDNSREMVEECQEVLYWKRM